MVYSASTRSAELVPKATLPFERSPTFFLPVGVNSTDSSFFSSFFVVFSVVSLVASPSEATAFAVTLVVCAVIAIVACGANQIAHTKNTIIRTKPPPIKNSFFLKLLKFGILGFFLAPLARGTTAETGLRALSSRSTASTAALSSLAGPVCVGAASACASSGSKAAPSITS